MPVCASVFLLHQREEGGLHNWAETHEIDIEGKESTTQAAEKEGSRGQDGFCRKPGEVPAFLNDRI